MRNIPLEDSMLEDGELEAMPPWRLMRLLPMLGDGDMTYFTSRCMGTTHIVLKVF